MDNIKGVIHLEGAGQASVSATQRGEQRGQTPEPSSQYVGQATSYIAD